MFGKRERGRPPLEEKSSKISIMWLHHFLHTQVVLMPPEHVQRWCLTHVHPRFVQYGRVCPFYPKRKPLLPQQKKKSKSRHAYFSAHLWILQAQEERDTKKRLFCCFFFDWVLPNTIFTPIESDKALEKGIKLWMIKKKKTTIPLICFRNTNKDRGENQQAAIMSLLGRRKKEIASGVKVLLF